MTKTNQRHKLLRKLIGTGVVCVLLCAIFVVCCNITVKNSAKGLLYDDVQTIPARKVGFVVRHLALYRERNCKPIL